MRLELTAVYQKVPEGGYVAWVEEFPGALTQGETLEETRVNLDDAVRLLIEGNREMHAATGDERQIIRERLIVVNLFGQAHPWHLNLGTGHFCLHD